MNYNNFTDFLIQKANSFDIKPVNINGVEYTFAEVVYKFRLAFLNPVIRKEFMPKNWNNNSIKPSRGFCFVTSYSLSKLFQELSYDFNCDFSHSWNLYMKEIVDVTGDQMENQEELDYHYKNGYYSQKSYKFSSAFEKMVQKNKMHVINKSEIFIAHVFDNNCLKSKKN